VTLIGVRDHLELWNRSDWDSREEELAARMPEIIARARRNRISPPPEKPPEKPL
jgi:DNA-binding transcriptional regulator/RsmH inhibitor MraZ